ncbi:MAG: Undecaprenyl-diphosphatase [Microgenomates group bacterium GW2011_GWA2_46_7]|nr:MAG: Undecaprenyl-diphosphatase [Microgenomates group bacterium GW2011_GWA2_46_7]
MIILHSLILGIVEGLTEFLPISSTFHLITAGRLLGLPNNSFTSMFEVVIQGGAILSLLFIYTKTFLANRELTLKVIFSFIPTALVGLILYKIIKGIFFSTHWLMLVVFVGMGILFLLVERLVTQGKLSLHKSLDSLSWKEAFLVGLAQSSAVMPGVSRSGSVISLMMYLGYRRDEAAKYTFLLSVPTILSASLLDLFQSRSLLVANPENFIPLLVGFVASFIVAYFVVKWLLHYLGTHTLALFAWYRFIVAALVLFILGT